MRRTWSLLLAASIALAPIPSFADPTAAQIAQAKEWFAEGLKLEEGGDWVTALDRFQKVSAVKTTPAIRFHVALCLEHIGRFAESLAEFRRAESDANADGSKDMKTVAANASKHIASLEERVPRVTIVLPDDVPASVTIEVDGRAIDRDAATRPLPLDPGPHSIAVRADDRKPFHRDVTLEERANLEVRVVLPAIAEKKNDDVAIDTPPVAPERSKGGNALPWIVGGVGVVSLATAGVFYLMRGSTINEVDASCQPGRTACDPKEKDVANKGKTYTTVGNVTLGVGVVAVGVAAILFATSSPAKDKPTQSAKVVLADGPAPIGLSLRGSF